MFAAPPATIFFNPFITLYGRVTRSDSFGFPWVRIAEPGMRNCRSQGRWQLHQSAPAATQAPTAATDASNADPSTCTNTSNATSQTPDHVPVHDHASSNIAAQTQQPIRTSASPASVPAMPSPTNSSSSSKLSADQAASIIAAAWRGTRLRHDGSALKQLAAASAQLSAVRQQLSEAQNSSGPMTQKQYLTASEPVMKVLLDLDATRCSVQETRALRKQLTVAANALLDAVQAEYQAAATAPAGSPAAEAAGGPAAMATAAAAAAGARDEGAAAAERAAVPGEQRAPAAADELYHDCESSSSDESDAEAEGYCMQDINAGLAAAAAAAGIAAAAAAAGFHIHRHLRQQQQHHGGRSTTMDRHMAPGGGE